MEKIDLIKFYCSAEGIGEEEVDKLVSELSKVLGTGEFKEAREELARVKEMALVGKRLLRENPELAERVFKEMVAERQMGEKSRQGTMPEKVKTIPKVFSGKSRYGSSNPVRSNAAVEGGAPVHQGAVKGVEPDP